MFVSLMTGYQLSSCGHKSMAGAIPVGLVAIRTWRGVMNTLCKGAIDIDASGQFAELVDVHVIHLMFAVVF